MIAGSPFDPVEYDGRTIEIGQVSSLMLKALQVRSDVELSCLCYSSLAHDKWP